MTFVPPVCPEPLLSKPILRSLKLGGCTSAPPHSTTPSLVINCLSSTSSQDGRAFYPVKMGMVDCYWIHGRSHSPASRKQDIV